jgi:hypothetical protein
MGYFLGFLLKGFQQECDNSGSLSDSRAGREFKGDSSEALVGTMVRTGMSLIFLKLY